MEVMKGILMPVEMVEELKEIAKNEKRSFTRQVLVFLEEVLESRKEKEKKGELER